MGERTSYTPGTFSWTDLSTTDQDGAKAFYGALFGWTADDMPADDQGTTYSMMSVDGRTVAAIAPQPQSVADAGAPPAWNSYVTVESVDAVAARAAELGATVAMPPFDVFDAGRMTGIVDPQGAFVLMWEPKGHIGAALVNAPGAMVWNELATDDVDASKSFYGDLLGWRISPAEQSPTPYWGIENAGHSNGGLREATPPGTPPHWLVYFGVDDLDAAMAKVTELGGTVHAGPIDVQIARIAVVADPQGATFAIYDGQLDP
jgi:predicted enzyme related to lactoylglutathione lyase